MVPGSDWKDRITPPPPGVEVGEDKERESNDSVEKEKRIKDIEGFRQLLKDEAWTKRRLEEMLGEELDEFKKLDRPDGARSRDPVDDE